MLEQEIKKVMKKKGLLPMDIYKPLKINRVNFYRAIKTSNLKNKTLNKILTFLDLELNIKLKTKKKWESKKKKFIKNCM